MSDDEICELYGVTLNDANSPEPEPEKLEWQTIPYWFAAIAGLIYATGFLVDYTFQNSLGIRSSVIDSFKGKYIYTGFLCLQFPATAVVMLFGFLRAHSKRENIIAALKTIEREEKQMLEAPKTNETDAHLLTLKDHSRVLVAHRLIYPAFTDGELTPSKLPIKCSKGMKKLKSSRYF